MDVFELRRKLIDDYAAYVKSFIEIRDDRIRQRVDEALDAGLLWPDPRIGLNPAFAEGAWVDDLVRDGVLHRECGRIFRRKPPPLDGKDGLRLHRHQVDAINAARRGGSYVLTTGTGSGKSLAYLVPIVDSVLRNPGPKGIKAIVVYPMNALANSQHQELEKFLCLGYPDGRGPVTFRRYTGQESDDEKNAIIADPPDILLTNFVMLELILTRVDERQLVAAAKGLRFLVLDELHTYRGRQGADVALLARRAKEACQAPALQFVGTSATLATGGSFTKRQAEVARVASLIFGVPVAPDDVIGETLRRSTSQAVPAHPEFVRRLRERVSNGDVPAPDTYEEFTADPLSSWIEQAFGVQTEDESDRLVRVPPRTIEGADGVATELAQLTSLPEDRCAAAIEQQLLAGYEARQPETDFPAFAFRLHQFISRGDTAYATPEPESVRHITLYPQQFVPGERNRVLLPLVFCRECGQEYYSVARLTRQGSDRVGISSGGFGESIEMRRSRGWPQEIGAQAVLGSRPRHPPRDLVLACRSTATSDDDPSLTWRFSDRRWREHCGHAREGGGIMRRIDLGVFESADGTLDGVSTEKGAENHEEAAEILRRAQNLATA